MEYSRLVNCFDDSVAGDGGGVADIDEDKVVGFDFNGAFGGNDLILSRVLIFGSLVMFPL